MKITNEFIRTETSYQSLFNVEFSEIQLNFINELNFVKYGSGWQFLSKLNEFYGDFENAIHSNLLLYEYNISQDENVVNELNDFTERLKKYSFLSIENENIYNEIITIK